MDEGAGTWEIAWERLRRRRGFRLGRLVLLVLGSLAVYAPFVANDRPLYLSGVDRGEHERARRTLVPVATALAGLLARSEAEFLAARAGDSRQGFEQALAAERAALATRLAALRRHLDTDRAGPLEAVLDEAAAGVTLAVRGEREAAARAGAELVRRSEALRDELDPARIELRPAGSSPVLASLAPVEVGLGLAWLAVLGWPLWRRRLRAPHVLALAVAAGTAAGFLWSAAIGGGSAFATSSFKEELTRGGIEAGFVLFTPVPYGFAEQHPEESRRPPTWLATAELDGSGAYVRGPRVPRPDPVTGFVPDARAVEVLAGEPALNSPWRHLLGTDATGRDVLARSIHGARASLLVGCLAAALLMGIGVAVGALAGYIGGRLDLLLSRLIEVVVSFPLFFLVLVAVAFVGPSIWNVILVIGCVGWTGVARLARAEFLRARELEYVEAARSLGFGTLRIVLRHVLPNALSPLLVAAAFAVAGAILVESALSFLGYGVRVPVASWGALTSESRDLTSWWLPLFPGLFLLLTVVCVQLVGDALRDALDPRLSAPRGPG